MCTNNAHRTFVVQVTSVKKLSVSYHTSFVLPDSVLPKDFSIAASKRILAKLWESHLADNVALDQVLDSESIVISCAAICNGCKNEAGEPCTLVANTAKIKEQLQGYSPVESLTAIFLGVLVNANKTIAKVVVVSKKKNPPKSKRGRKRHLLN